MISFSFNIDNPRPKSNGLESIDYILTEKKISKNWAFACQLTNERSLDRLFDIFLNIGWSGESHAGPRFSITVLGWFFNIAIFNVNHWNYEEGRWYREDEGDEE